MRFATRSRPFCPPMEVSHVALLVPEARAVAGIVWQRRNANEQASVVLAERMHLAAHTLALPRSVLEALARFRDDEQRHVDATTSVLRVLGLEPASPQAIRTPLASEATALSFARDVLVGLVVCESVSAARFAVVRAATDLPVFRQVIASFLRDEVAHGALGLLLLPLALSMTLEALGSESADAWALDTLMSALLELELTVGLDGARKGLEPSRPQPAGNPGIVEPNLDAHAFYRAVVRHLLPRLEAAGLPVRERWEKRFARPTTAVEPTG